MTDTFYYTPAATANGTKPPLNVSALKQQYAGGYFQKQKAFQEFQRKQQQSSSIPIQKMIHMSGMIEEPHTNTIVVGALDKQLPNNQQQQQKQALFPPNKGLVSHMQEQLKQLSEDLIQHTVLTTFAQANLTMPPCQTTETKNSCASSNIWDYLDTVECVDAEEQLATPVYFTGTEMNPMSARSSSAKQPSNGGFLPTAFNSIRNLVENVIRLPSLIRNSWLDANPATPEHQCTDNDYGEPFFDVEDFDFYPNDDEGPHTLPLSLPPPEHHHHHPNVEMMQPIANSTDLVTTTKLVSKMNLDKLVDQQAVTQSKVDRAATTTVTDDETEKYHVPELDHPEEAAVALQETIANGNEVGEGENVRGIKELSPELPSSDRPTQGGNEHGKTISVVEPLLCTRTFVCTPDEEIGSGVANYRRKRQPTATTTLLTRSTPISVKGSSVGASYRRSHCYRPDPRTLYHQSTRRNKNRKKKQRQNIATNIHEDYQLSSDTETEDLYGAFSFEEDSAWLPITARNLMEPSCLTNLNSPTASTSSCRRRNSINFQSASAYEKEFPVIGGEGAATTTDDCGDLNDGTGTKPNLLRGVVIKGNGIYFEIPNSPQRRRLLTGGPSRVKPKLRTNSIMSSSVGSSPATSLDAGGKFWEHPKAPVRRIERTVSECSDDDLIEFVRESGDEDLPDLFSSDEDYSSDSETESDSEEGEFIDTDEDEDDDEEVSTEDEDLVFDRSMCKGKLNLSSEAESTPERKLQDDLPDSGLEEKKVRFVGKPQVRVLRAWNYAHRQARKGHWEEVGRDRVRFAARIHRLEADLKPILMPQHRDKIYNSRFAAELDAIR